MSILAVAMVLTGAAAAGEERAPSPIARAAAAPCSGDSTMIEQRIDEHTVVRHSGTPGDPATVLQRGAQGEIVLRQSGPCNEASVTQANAIGGSGPHRATVHQTGSGNRAVVVQRTGTP